MFIQQRARHHTVCKSVLLFLHWRIYFRSEFKLKSFYSGLKHFAGISPTFILHQKNIYCGPKLEFSYFTCVLYIPSATLSSMTVTFSSSQTRRLRKLMKMPFDKSSCFTSYASASTHLNTPASYTWGTLVRMKQGDQFRVNSKQNKKEAEQVNQHHLKINQKLTWHIQTLYLLSPWSVLAVQWYHHWGFFKKKKNH